MTLDFTLEILGLVVFVAVLGGVLVWWDQHTAPWRDPSINRDQYAAQRKARLQLINRVEKFNGKRQA
jgi:uncharacterized iron-regulated membrane protein